MQSSVYFSNKNNRGSKWRRDRWRRKGWRIIPIEKIGKRRKRSGAMINKLMGVPQPKRQTQPMAETLYFGSGGPQNIL